MLLAVDVGNTQTVFGLYEATGSATAGGSRPRRTGQRTSSRSRSSPTSSTSGRSTGSAVSSTVPRLVDGVRARRRALGESRDAGHRPRRSHRDRDPVRRPARGRPRPGRQRGRRARSCYGAPGDRRRLRHVDELRRRVCGRGVRRRGPRAGDRGLDGRALRTRGPAGEGRLRRAAAGDRQRRPRRAAVGARLRLRRPGRRHRRRDPRGARGRCAGHRDRRSRRPHRPALAHDRRRSTPFLTLEGLRLVWELNRAVRRASARPRSRGPGCSRACSTRARRRTA